MIRALTAEQMRAAERRSLAETGASLETLMRRAGEALAGEVASRMTDGSVVVMAGPGNNGGDGWVCARILKDAGRSVMVYSVVDPANLSGAAAGAFQWAAAGEVAWEAPASAPTISDASVVVDALLGIGASGPMRDAMPEWIDAVNAAGAFVVSADIPTGVDSDSGAVVGSAVEADVTVTFSAAKIGLVQYPGAAYVGEVVLADVGIPGSLLDVAGAPEVWERDDYAELMPLPAPEVHKDARGRVLVVAGSAAYPGAAILAVRGAQRAGAGYVTLACPEPMVLVAHNHLVSAPVVGMPAAAGRAFASRALERILSLSAEYDAVVLGPGLTLADGAVVVARGIVSKLDKPLVVDADGLNALVDAVGLLDERRAPTVLTPHPGEMARLAGVRPSDVQGGRLAASGWFAAEGRAVVLKGAGTVVSEPGRQVIVTSGTPALATAGTGDVLAGMIGALLAQGLDPLSAGALGAWWHGRAGEIAASAMTPMCVTSEDIPDFIPQAASELLWT